MWNAWLLLFRQFKLMQNLSSKLSFYINAFHMFSTFFISIWSLFTENNLWRCITYFLPKNKKKIKNFQKIFLEYSNTNYLDMCPVTPVELIKLLVTSVFLNKKDIWVHSHHLSSPLSPPIYPCQCKPYKHAWFNGLSWVLAHSTKVFMNTFTAIMHHRHLWTPGPVNTIGHMSHPWTLGWNSTVCWLVALLLNNLLHIWGG